MNRSEIHRRAHSVIDALTDLEPGADQAQGPGWRKAVRNRLRTQHWPTLTAALGPDHDQAVTALVAMLTGTTAAALDHTDRMQQARNNEFERHHRRLNGLPPACARCDDVGIWFDEHNLGHECNHQPEPTPAPDPNPSIVPASTDPSSEPVEAP